MNNNTTSIWLKCSKNIWTQGYIIKKINETQFQVYNNSLETETIVNEQEFFIANKITNKKNLIDLIHLHEPAILNSLKLFYNNDNIYTWTGPILIAINPFKILPIYTTELLEQHCLFGINNNKMNTTPHVYSIADWAYRKLCNTNTSQSILISGESGAGKTVSTKIIMKYLTQIGSSKSTSLNNIESTILESNPILEAFGNAATIRNNNSSRFGKYIKLCFKDKILNSGCIETYLLELVRIIKQVGDERNFHIFYQLFSGLNNEELGELYLNRDTTYKIINPVKIDGINDRIEFDKTRKALNIMKISNLEQQEIWKVVASVILFGELDCKSLSATDENIIKICDLLNLNANLLVEKLTTKKIVTPSETFTKPLNHKEITKTRDTIIKIFYDQLFKLLVKTINSNINIDKKSSHKFIGILDIFGFEVFKHNYFEQLCINYTNEILQQQFNKYIFKLEQLEYNAEKIDWTNIDFPDNQDCIDLITSKPFSIFTLLDEECQVGEKNDTAYHRKVLRHLNQHPRLSFTNKMKAKGLFSINHYAGNVTYNTKDFCFKNIEIMSPELLEIIDNCKLPLVCKMSNLISTSTNKNSVNKNFQKQLSKLIKLISKTDTHYIRCIKPNDINQPNKFNNTKVVEQLRYAGVLEAIKVARAGYPIRFKKMEFANDFLPIFNWKFHKSLEIDSIINNILSNTDIENNEYQIGITKIFFKKDAFHNIENIKNNTIFTNSTKIQANIRGFLIKQKWIKTKKSTIKIQSCLRRYLAIKLFKILRSNYWAQKIQTWWRSRFCLNNFLKVKSAIQTIQLFLRKRKTIKTILLWCNKWYSARKLQTKWRQYYHRNKYLGLVKACFKIQKWIKTKKLVISTNIPVVKNIKKNIVRKSTIKTIPKSPITKNPKNNDRINNLENTILEMQNNFQSMIKSLSDKIDKPNASPEVVGLLKNDIKEKDHVIHKKNKEIVRKNKVIEKSKIIIEKQNSIIQQDEIVKRDMGKRLQDVLLELNKAQEELVKLRKMKVNNHRKNWFW